MGFWTSFMEGMEIKNEVDIWIIFMNFLMEYIKTKEF